MGEDLQHLLGRGLQLHPCLPVDAAQGREGPHRQYQQRQRFLGLGINAPHIKCSVVMPGHIGTSIPLNSRKIQGGNLSDEIDARQIAQARARLASMGRDAAGLSDDDIRKLVGERERRFREDAPTSAAEAAAIILDGVKADRWRILVGKDAHQIDERVRRSPEQAYDLDFFESFAREAGWRIP
jgi:hypothetical protein